MRRWAAACLLAGTAGAAEAGETVLYRPAPAWVLPAPALSVAEDAPAMLLLDSQRRVEKGRLWTFIDTATRVASAEMLAQAGTVAIPWSPEQGDLIVHRLEIVRGPERIDLLKQGQRFSVLRREEGLERRMLDGLLTATLPVQGLQVGDVLRVTVSITAADPLLGGRAQAVMTLPADPFRAGFARTRLQWPVGERLAWRAGGTGPAPAPRVADGWNEVTLALPLAKRPEAPADAPARFRRPPLLEASGFTDWAEVSRVMAPLFATEGLIRPGDALDAQVQAITAATPDQLQRTERALELVQDKVRYLLMGMAGGHYRPQPPAQTWEVRYGDCKAKTLLLLAMLRRMGVEAEAVLASSEGGDALPDRLPMPGAFDHVLVRARVNGETLWLDGTGAGARLADIHDTPAFRHVLPLRPEGAGLLPVAMRAPARPQVDARLELDETAGLDLPRLFSAAVTVRGAMAAQLAAFNREAPADKKRELAARLVGTFIEDPTLSEFALRHDPAEGTVVVTASGLADAAWTREDRRFKRALDRSVTAIEFQPNRAKPAWAAIPVATADPSSVAVTTRVRLPDGGRGFALEDASELRATLAGTTVRRRIALADGVATVEERADTAGAEIAPGEVAAERARLAAAKARPPKLVAPADAPRYWQPGSAARLKAVEAAFAKAVALDRQDAGPLQWRARVRSSTGDRRGAVADYTLAIAIEPTVDLLLERANVRRELREDKAALADAEAAITLDPASDRAVTTAAYIRSNMGDGAGAIRLLDERLEGAGKERGSLLRTKAEIQADGGDAAAAIATMDEALAEKPGDPNDLNMRCWVKGTRATALDTALKDCTKSIELSDDPASALDSRAMAYFRMNRADDALADLDAALELSPDQAGSLFLRGVIRKARGDATGAAADLAQARALSPRIDVTYGRYGVKP